MKSRTKTTSTSSLRARARRLEAERAPLPRASAEEARAAFPAPAYDAQVFVDPPHAQPARAPNPRLFPPEILSLVLRALAPWIGRHSPQDVACEVAAQLARSGVPGEFVATALSASVRLDWQGAAHHRGEAERALVDALSSRGYAAGALPGLGVRVTVLSDPKAPPAGSQAPAWASRPAALHAAARDLSGPRGLGPVAPAEMDPHECAGSLVGRVLRYRAEV